MAPESPAPSGPETLHAALMEAIADQRLAPGDRLTETELAAIFGLSRRQVEKALVRLCVDGLATAEANRGVFVARPDAAEARDVFALRRLLEREATAAATRAAAAGDRALVPALRAAMAAEHAARAAGDARQAVRRSGEFHSRIGDASGNRELAGLVRRLVARSALIVRLHRNEAAMSGWHDDHGRLVDLIAAGEAEAAGAEMVRHLEAVESALRLDLPAAAPPGGLRGALLGG
ncbi:MAG: GntR family transcriptional regulator [Pseudomonadota bacterium]|nr:GntR family transcriptional regulator [Pseudomonadota bacterium]